MEPLPSVLSGTFALHLEATARLFDHRDGVITVAPSSLVGVARATQTGSAVSLTLTICELGMPRLADPTAYRLLDSQGTFVLQSRIGLTSCAQL